MKMLARWIVGFSVLLFGGAQGATFSPDFSDYSFPGTQYDVDSAANAYFSGNYGITADRMYLYLDSRDTFDGIGLANGFVADNYANDITGRIDFVDGGTDFVTIDYLAILPATYAAYTDGGVLVDSFFSGGNDDVGTRTLSGAGLIGYLTVNSQGGYATVSGLTYNFDGSTDGTNDDLVGVVPIPAALPLLGSGLAGLALVARRRKKLNA